MAYGSRVRPRVILVVCGVLALAIGLYAVLAPSALPRLRELESEQARLQGEVDAARTKNEKLAKEVTVLQGGQPESKAVLEKAAREELGWTKPDEIVFTGLPTSRASRDRPGVSSDREDESAGGRR